MLDKLKEFETYAKMRFAAFTGAEKLLDSVAYSLFSAGKRIRPAMMLAIASLQENNDYHSIFPLALALEMVHTYSLIHDDLPCMDNDILRRGKPTNHIAFDEATALLAGDALLSQSFEVLLETDVSAEKKVTLASEFAKAIGISGMVTGQVYDMALDHKKTTDTTLVALRDIHYHKTGKLFEFAILAPIVVYDYPLAVKTLLQAYAKNIGILFQAMDDYLDVCTEIETGKTKGIDALNDKITYLSFFTVAELETYITNLAQECKQTLMLLTVEGYQTVELTKILQMILRK